MCHRIYNSRNQQVSLLVTFHGTQIIHPVKSNVYYIQVSNSVFLIVIYKMEEVKMIMKT